MTIYETVPEENFKKFGDKNKLIEFLQENKGTFFTANILARKLGYRETNTQVELRRDIAEAIESGYPIISNAKGFGWPVNSSQILFCIESLEARISGIKRRVNSLKKIYNDLNEVNIYGN